MSDELIIGLSIFIIAATCSLMGLHLILRKQAMLGDAISHAVLPGLVIFFLLFKSFNSWVLFCGALTAGILTSYLIEAIKSHSFLKEDTSMGIVFTAMFSIGVILVNFFTRDSHIDAECLLFGDITFLPLEDTINMGIAIPYSLLEFLITFLAVVGLCTLFHKEFIICAFHEQMAKSLSINTTFIHYLLMILVSTAIVISFEAVGVILVIALLIIPPSFGKLFSNSFRGIYFLSLILIGISIFLGIPLAFKYNSNISAMVVSVAFLIFCFSFLLKLLLQHFSTYQIKKSVNVGTN